MRWDHKDHLGPNGNRLIADVVFRKLSDYFLSCKEDAGTSRKEETLSSPSASIATPSPQHLDTLAIRWLQGVVRRQLSKNKQIHRWLAKVPRFPDSAARIGAIVMNCNPMTMGHVHCIQKALRFVDGLYIFVVQDDKSYFPFKNRFAIVRKVCLNRFKDKVCVVPSGNFIISSFSFPGYFTKEKQELTAEDRDSSFDVAIFGSTIAPALRITQRFVGDEPLCPVTREYNDVMQTLLPPMGVKVRVFPRKEQGDAPISASRVRALLQAGDLEGMRPLVPGVTFGYLTRLHQRRKTEQLPQQP